MKTSLLRVKLLSRSDKIFRWGEKYVSYMEREKIDHYQVCFQHRN